MFIFGYMPLNFTILASEDFSKEYIEVFLKEYKNSIPVLLETGHIVPSLVGRNKTKTDLFIEQACYDMELTYKWAGPDWCKYGEAARFFRDDYLLKAAAVVVSFGSDVPDNIKEDKVTPQVFYNSVGYPDYHNWDTDKIPGLSYMRFPEQITSLKDEE